MIEGNFDITPENAHTSDPSMPRFKFNQNERDEMLDQGMTEADITAKEVEISNRQAKAKFDAESQKEAA